MYRILALFFLICAVDCASYRYDESTRYPYNTYSTSNYPNQYQTRSSYNSDIANFPEATRYPNYSPGYSTSSYNTYSTQRPGVGFYPGSYSTQGYGSTYGSQYGTQYGSQYGSNSPYGSGSQYGNQYGSQYSGKNYSPYEMPFMNDISSYCLNRAPQKGIWVDSLMGMWYGVEFIQHLAGDSRVDYARSCIVIHIAEPMDRPSTENQLFHVQHINAKFRQEYRHLRLLWDEAGHTIEYALYFRNDSAGYWRVFDGQNGTLTSRPNYQQFSGSVQVLKAVNDHLVLNFCQEAANGRPAQLYSVLFSREPGLMPRWEMESIHALLQTKNLSVASRRMVCGNSATRTLYNAFQLFILIALTYVVGSKNL